MSGNDGIPSIWLEFDEHAVVDREAAAQLTALLDQPNIEDLVVMSHGWKNDKDDAANLYRTLWANTCTNFAPGVADRTVVAGVSWPAKAFRTDFDTTALAQVNAGGALSVGGGGPAITDLPEQEFETLLREFECFMGPSGAATVAAARTAANKLNANESASLIKQGATAVGVDPQSPDPELARDAGPIARARGEPTNAQFLLSNLLEAPRLRLAPKVGSAMGLGSAVRGLISGSRAAVARFLNQLTYYEMKKRSGAVGESLADNLLAKLAPARPIRLHLVGHSFGGRLVTAAANQFMPSDRLDLFSLTVLQGAYSHNALSRKIAGAFPQVAGKPKGPIVFTHTHNDLACTIAYALASRLSRDIAKSIGDASDDYGAMGANGPQKLEPGAAEPDDTTQAFEPTRGKVNTILADEFIVETAEIDAHNNVTNATVGRLLAKTILAAVP